MRDLSDDRGIQYAQHGDVLRNLTYGIIPEDEIEGVVSERKDRKDASAGRGAEFPEAMAFGFVAVAGLVAVGTLFFT